MEEDFKAELDWARERLADINAYAQTEAFDNLSAEDKSLIVEQASALDRYVYVVGIRASKVA